MEPSSRDFRERNELLKINRSLNRSIESCRDELRKLKRYLLDNEKKLSIYDNPGYGPAFDASRRVEIGPMSSEAQERRMIGRIHKIGIDLTPHFNVDKKLIASKHTHVPRCLEFSPADDCTYVTTCKGGRFNLWDCTSTVEDPNIVGTLNLSAANRKWPDDVAFFPRGDRLIAAFKTPDIDQQLALITFDRHNTEGGNSVRFLQYINRRGLTVAGGFRRVIFPERDHFITAGEDHSVFIWRWRPDNVLRAIECHRTTHTNHICGLCCLWNRTIVLSGSLDKRIVAYDYGQQKEVSVIPLDKPCLSVVPNPINPNLILIQKRNPGKQFQLIDYRTNNDLCDFGWSQEHTDTQYESVSPTWSPSGWLIATGSADPVIHLFDIRINRVDASQTIMNAHNKDKRVFKAAFHPQRPILISIAADLLLGYHTLKFESDRI